MRRKAILLTTRHDNTEMEELAFALGVDLVAKCYQRRPQADPQLFLGSGKTEEARDIASELAVDLVLVNGHLKANQIFNLQRFFMEDPRVAARGEAPEVYDRTRLILEIFRDRAGSPEARLQVELAQIHYEMPLIKESIHLSKKGEHPGFLGGGEYEVNQYHDMMKKRMSRIRRELEKMRRERGVRRKHRRRGGFHLVSLAGYTNAGKSSLLRALSQKDVLIENRYFSTLSTKTARALSDRREILVTDTVGFIEDLPPWMVEAFHSTLEEIALADVILLVLDASDPPAEMARRLRSSLRILWEFDGSPDIRGASWGPVTSAARYVSAEHGAPLVAAPPSAATPPADAAFALAAEDDATRPSATSPGAIAHTRSANDTEAAPLDMGPARPQAPLLTTPSMTPIAPDVGNGSLLVPLRRGMAPILVALNKVDRLAPGEVDERLRFLEEEGLADMSLTVPISAHTGEGLEALFDHLYDLIPDYDEYEMSLPQSPEGESFIAWIHESADVLDLTRGNEVHLHFEAKRSLRPEVRQRLAAVGARPLRESFRASEQDFGTAKDANGDEGPLAEASADADVGATTTARSDERQEKPDTGHQEAKAGDAPL